MLPQPSSLSTSQDTEAHFEALVEDTEAHVETQTPVGVLVSWFENNILMTVLAFLGFLLLALCLCKLKLDTGFCQRSLQRHQRWSFMSKVSMEKARSLNIADMSTVAHETRRPVQAPSMSTPAAARVVPVDTDTMRLQRETVAMRLRIQEVDALVSRIQDAQAPSQRAKPSLKAAVHTVQIAQHMEQRSLVRQQRGLVEGKLAPLPAGLPPGFAEDTAAMRRHLQGIQSAHAASQRKKPSLKAAVHTVQAAQHMERVKLTRARQGLLEGRHAKSPERMPPGFGNRRESDADDEEYHDGLYTGATSPPRDRAAIRRAPTRNLFPNETQAADAEPSAWDPGPSPSWHHV